MSTLQIRDVPDEVSRELKARAAEAGQSLSQYALAQLVHGLQRPRVDLQWARIQTEVLVERGSVHAADLIRAERAGRP